MPDYGDAVNRIHRKVVHVIVNGERRMSSYSLFSKGESSFDDRMLSDIPGRVRRGWRCRD
jgi:hypothetical protein